MCDAPGQKLNSAAELVSFKNWASADSDQPGSPRGKMMPNVTSDDLGSVCELSVLISHFHCAFWWQFCKYLLKWIRRGSFFRLWRVGRETAFPFVFQKYERCSCMREACCMTFRGHKWGGRPCVEGGMGREGKVITVAELRRGVTQNIGNIFSLRRVF